MTFISLNKFAQADWPEDKIQRSFRDQTFWFVVKLIFEHHISGSGIIGAEFKFWSNQELWPRICWPHSFHGHCNFWSLIIRQRDAANLVREFAQSRIWSFSQSGAIDSFAILWLLIVSIEDTQLQLLNQTGLQFQRDGRTTSSFPLMSENHQNGWNFLVWCLMWFSQSRYLDWI